MIKTKRLKISDWIVALICLIVILLCVMPMLNLLAQSLSSSQSVIFGRVSFLPVIHNQENNTHNIGITLESYRYVFLDKSFSRSMWWTAILTVICTIVSLTMTVLCAYPLTYDQLKGKTLINTIIIITMYFSAGTIPNYVLMKSLNLLNNPLVLIIPNCLSVFNMIILRSFFFGVPDSLRESAEIDGATPFTVLVKIYLPLSGPVLATLALFYAVGRWNGFGDALIYLSSAPQWVPIQLKLWQLIQNTSGLDISTVELAAGSIPRASDAIKAAAIMFATLPILVVYPWLQRYFIKGVTIGAVKG
ncbi:MAG: carbohydrate ABC transporter permease [Treponema sp.]|nr:carbohydrate ABC transporter permease [Treponema sp.]